MRKLLPQLVAIAVLAGVYTGRYLFEFSEMSYLDFLVNKYVLNFVLIGTAIAVGYFVRSYLITLACASFALLVYCLAFVFESKEVVTSLFFAIYTVFVGVAAAVNLVRCLRDGRFPKVHASN